MSDFILLPEYKEAIKSIQSNPLTFVSGPAGSGKSTFIKYIQKKVKNSVLLAPTGIAAINIGGRTIHSVFKLPPKFITEEDIKFLKGEIRQYLKSTNLIIIDEVSMVSSNLLDALDSILQKNMNNDLPFGGIHILLVGDLFQLPPIVSYETQDLFNSCYASPMFFDSFVIQNLMEQNKFKAVKLNRVLRQKDDTFITILNAIRTGNKADIAVRLLNRKVKYLDKAPDGYVQITPYNEVSDRTNREKLDELTTPVKSYFGTVHKNFNPKNFPVAQDLSLKVGAQIMVTKNIDAEIVNGTIGRVLQLDNEFIEIKTDKDRTIRLERVTWTEYGYGRDEKGNIKSEVTGTYTQFPVKLAWSMTIHKVQSASIKNLYVDMSKGAFAPGMLYVALSRATHLESLYLSKPINYEDVIVDQNVIDFYNSF